MRSRGLWVPLVLWAQLLAQACGAPPSGGGPCSSDALTCDGSHGVFACIAGAWVSVPCEGPGGCTGAGSTLECDTSVATPGSRCPPWKAGQTQCLKNPVAVLQCVDSTWKMTSPCTQCMVKSGKAQCHEPTGCGPSNCAGCCSADQCLAPPLNVTANTCGAGGGACQDCQALGMVCAAASATCEAASAPCSDASESGQCVSSTVVRFCSLPSGLGTPAVQAYTCAAGTTCLSGGNGATCRSAAATCRDGETRCSGQTALESCTTSGTWAGSTCAAGCRGSAVGGYCPPATATTTLTGKLTYLSRGPNARRPTGWTTAAAVPAYNVAVVVQAANGLWVDVAVTGRDGRYSIKVPTAPATGSASPSP
jgi:hypothetical protein